MMELRRRTPSRRLAKATAVRDNYAVQPYYRHKQGKGYEFCLGFYDNATGTSFEIAGSQLEWEVMIEQMQRRFTEAPA